MSKETIDSLKTSYILRKFYTFFLVFSIIPILALYYLYIQYDNQYLYLEITKERLRALIFLICAAALLSFFVVRGILRQIVFLAEKLKKTLIGKVDKNIILDLANGKGEVAELAKSFSDIFSRLENNIRELEATKKSLHGMLLRVAKAFSSMENFNILVSLVLETVTDALGISRGVIIFINASGDHIVKASVGISDVSIEEIKKASETFIQWAIKENRIISTPVVDGKHESKNTLFSPPLICSPLTYREKVWGILCVSGKKNGGNFTDDELNIVANLSSQIAIAFANDQLNRDAERTYLETMSALALAVEARDPYSRGHSDRVCEYAVKIGVALGLSDKEVQALRDAAKLHDIGKIGVSDSVLLKPAPLEGQERESIEKHPVIGEGIVMPLKSFGHLLDPIRHHHEFLDGSGYPDKLKAEQIPLISRIMVVADVYDALVTNRPYKQALEPQAAIKILKNMVDEGKIDGKVVDTFVRLINEASPNERAKRV